MQDLIGRTLGHYRITGKLGEGGMGAVYVGFDEKLQRQVALKAVRTEYWLHEQAKARFLREARILSQLDHPHVCTIHDYIEGESSDFIVLELVTGKNLREAMKDAPDYSTKMYIGKQLVEVLVAVHGQGVIHRDLKPENVMLTDTGDIKVLDFGLSRSTDQEQGSSSSASTVDLGEVLSESETLAPWDLSGSSYVKTELGTVLGTVRYMSPEQARGEPATAASDMYSLGLVLQELFTGQPPFEDGLDSATLLQRAAGGDTRPVTGLPPDLTSLINRLKSVAPGTRPSSVDALVQLQIIIDKPGRRRKRVLVAATWIALAMLAVGMGIQSMRAQRQTRRALEEKERAERIYQDVAASAYREGRFTLASQIYFTAVGNSDDPKFRAKNNVMAAWTLYALGDDDEVLRPLREAIRDDPELQLQPDYYTPDFVEVFETARAQVDDGYEEAVPRPVREDFEGGEFSDCRSPFKTLEDLRSDRPSYLPHLNLVDALACVQPGWSKAQVRAKVGEPSAKPGTGEWHYDWLADNEEAFVLFSCSVTFEDGGVVEVIAEVDYDENAEGTE